MEKALELMPSGIISVWTHKAILPEVVSIMHGLGALMHLLGMSILKRNHAWRRR